MSAPLMSAQQWLIERDANGREWPFKALFFSFPQSQSSSLRPGLQTRRDWLVCSHSMFFALRRRISCVSTCCSTFMHLLLFYCCRTPSLTEDESRHLTVLAPREAEAYLLESHRFAVKKKRKKVTQIFYYLRLLTDNERNPRNVQCERGIAHFQQSSRSPPPLDCPTSIRAPFKNPSLCTESQSWPKDFFSSSVFSRTTAQVVDIDIYLYPDLTCNQKSVPRSDWRAQRRSKWIRHLDHRFCTYSLTLESYTVQLHMSEHKI